VACIYNNNEKRTPKDDQKQVLDIGVLLTENAKRFAARNGKQPTKRRNFAGFHKTVVELCQEPVPDLF